MLSAAPAAALAELKQNSIGLAFESYIYQGKLLALPIDAATPAPSWRRDLLERAGVEPPQTWPEAVALARRKLAVIPGFGADLFLHFVMLVKDLGADPFTDPEKIASRAIMQGATGMLRELTEPMPREIFDLNPILLAERMTATDDFAWNAFAYTYNNYARPGFSRHALQFGPLLSIEPGGPRLRSVMGGTGVAISANCTNAAAALDYALFIAGGVTQQGIYVQAGGQPSHRAAWDDKLTDDLCGGFFTATRQPQTEAFIRPRYSGYVGLQTTGGVALQEYLRGGSGLASTMDKLDQLYRRSRLAGAKDYQTN
jgi:multiple sugar transport system substrate-binding protein